MVKVLSPVLPDVLLCTVYIVMSILVLPANQKYSVSSRPNLCSVRQPSEHLGEAEAFTCACTGIPATARCQGYTPGVVPAPLLPVSFVTCSPPAFLFPNYLDHAGTYWEILGSSNHDSLSSAPPSGAQKQ